MKRQSLWGANLAAFEMWDLFMIQLSNCKQLLNRLDGEVNYPITMDPEPYAIFKILLAGVQTIEETAKKLDDEERKEQLKIHAKRIVDGEGGDSTPQPHRK